MTLAGTEIQKFATNEERLSRFQTLKFVNNKLEYTQVSWIIPAVGREVISDAVSYTHLGDLALKGFVDGTIQTQMKTKAVQLLFARYR